jgi:hypothetical protein
MNKFGIAIVVACLMALTAGTVSADLMTYDFTDTLSWAALNDGYGQKISFGQSFGYQHDITDDVDFGAGDDVIAAKLTLQFSDVELVGEWEWVKKWVSTSWGGYWQYGWEWQETWQEEGSPSEEVRVAFDGQSWIVLGDVDTGTYDLVVDLALLNDNGKLDVTVDVYNRKGDVYLTSSVLTGTAQVVPVPGAVLLGVLGLGAAGMKLRRRNAA